MSPGERERANRIAQSLKQEFAHSPERTSRSFLYFGGFLVCVLLAAGGLAYWQFWRRRRAEWALNDPMALIKELNYVHQLSDREKRLMQELSVLNALSTPLKLFVEPKFFLDALESDTLASDHPSVRQLLSKLFDITAEAEETAVFTNSSHKQGIV